jgi:hypothetical protein
MSAGSRFETEYSPLSSSHKSHRGPQRSQLQQQLPLPALRYEQCVSLGVCLGITTVVTCINVAHCDPIQWDDFSLSRHRARCARWQTGPSAWLLNKN